MPGVIVMQIISISLAAIYPSNLCFYFTRFQTSESPNASLLSNSRRSYLYDDDHARSTSPKTTSYSQDVL